MSRFIVLRCGALLLFALLIMSCGEKEPANKAPDPRELQMQKVRQQAADLRMQTAQLKERINTIASHITEDQRRLEERIREVDQLQENIAALTLTAEGLDTSRRELDETEAAVKREAEKRGWPWVLYLVVAAALVLSVVLFKHLNRDDETEDDSLGDEGFSEENDMGTIRYPGKQGDSNTTKQSD
jgi:septal ring factor EnvC (AmiA/AmiB activator)